MFREQIEALVGGRRRSADPRDLHRPQRASRSRPRRPRSRRRRDGDRGPGHHRRLRQPARRHIHRSVHPQARRVARGRRRLQLLGRPEGHAGDHREDGPVHGQAPLRHAQRGPSFDGRGAQDLPLLARVHGAIRAAAALGGRAHPGRLLRHHAGAHQTAARRSPLAPARSRRLSVTVEEPAAKAQALAGRPAGREVPAGGQAGRRASSSPSWRSCRRGAWTPPRRSRAPGCAPSTASTPSTCPTARAPARA